ncbi:MAG: prepilin-type N-terminal cleavage/methylation domain-containing protein [Desulfurivibrionaceae bacterium]|jgi:type IV pilus assembly protein PilW
MYPSQHNPKGFSLVELMIAVAISSAVMIGIWAVYSVQERTGGAQEVLTDLQQNLRTAIFTMTQEIRTAGFDPTGSGNFGITFVGFQEQNNAGAVVIGNNSALIFTADNGAGANAENGILDADETYTFSLFQFGWNVAGGVGTGTTTDLGRNTGAGLQPFVQNIEALGLAYAYDLNGDGALDTYTVTAGPLAGTQQVIWAIDSNNDGTLDTLLDTNGDGNIFRNDGPSANADVNAVVNENIVGVPIAPAAEMKDIRAIRIWIVTTEDAAEHGKYLDQYTYVVGRRIYTPRDNRRRRLLDTIVYCKNMGLQ